ncbi:GSCFA family protein [Pseudovibrio sp. Ad5]|uniref:GSCFA domain-containing protein n=1 Tax=Pseudovibrio sp. Ad5 TaxID=989436 RepID=UPI0007AEE00D|nr:GSCFA domain-containing protein [Pseudovibrio sp. Ad5]KZK97254.1 GSCFA family protein [Pseudovibrio sp. Ad5]
MRNPYQAKPPSAFWKSGVVSQNPYRIDAIYKKKFDISGKTRIAAAGSCFAQHISRHLKKHGYSVLDVEKAPPGLPENSHKRFGFSTYSARYGNIYTTRQLLQLAREVSGKFSPEHFIWEKDGKFYDAFRPAVEPDGLDSPEEVSIHRRHHIKMVEKLFKEMDLFIFTLGLTELWMHEPTKTIYPTAPGTIAGVFSDEDYVFQNESYGQVLGAFNDFQTELNEIRDGRPFNVILTVSPVPLTATASDNHVLVATNYSKAVLRAVAGQLSTDNDHIDYFPSYDIVTNPRLHSTAFEENLRSVRAETVEYVMKHFFSEHPAIEAPAVVSASQSKADELLKDEDIQCEEELLEAFGK